MNERIYYLLQQYVNKNCTYDELNELAAIAGDQQYREQVEIFMDERYDMAVPVTETDEVDWEGMYKKIIDKQPAQIYSMPDGEGTRRKAWKVWLAAASVTGLLLLAGYWLTVNQNPAGKEDKLATVTQDVKAPATNRAMITLANGKTVFLDSAANGALVTQGNVQLVKLSNGQIAYQTTAGDASTSFSAAYNTLSNPRGSKVIDMVLADGSHVWLNAGSSVTYPVAFVGNERKVSITGEAYFEVTHNAGKPFYVSKGDVQVQVLGTHFNVNAYDDETDIKVTLLEGSVKASMVNGESSILKPGEQAQVSNRINVVKDVDVAQVMAWKNGQFELNGNVKDIMKQVARWYDVEIEYTGNVTNKKFGGTLSREENVSKLLKYLELTGSIHFKIEGRKVIVAE